MTSLPFADSPIQPRRAIWVFLGLILINVGIVFFVQNDSLRVSLTDLMTPIIGLLSSAALFYTAWMMRSVSSRVALVWLFLALGCLCWVLGDIFWAILEVFLQKEPFFAGWLQAKHPEFPEADIIVRGSQRLERMLDRIRNYLKPVEIHQKDCSVNGIIKDAVYLLAPEIDKHAVFCRLDLDPKNPTVRADLDVLNQVFINLIRNAIGAMNQGEALTIKSSQESQQVHIEFRNRTNKPKIKNPELLFLPFDEGGQSIGLPLCYRLVKTIGVVLSFADRNKTWWSSRCRCQKPADLTKMETARRLQSQVMSRWITSDRRTQRRMARLFSTPPRQDIERGKPGRPGYRGPIERDERDHRRRQQLDCGCCDDFLPGRG